MSISHSTAWMVYWYGVTPNGSGSIMVLIYLVAILVLFLVNVIYLVYLERLFAYPAAFWYNRVEGACSNGFRRLKLLRKDIIPNADKWVFRIAAILIMVPAIMAFAIIPFGQGMMAIDLNWSILFYCCFLNCDHCILMAGWGF